MATERDATCPECGGVRTTKAAQRVRITCFECGTTFRAPPVAKADDDAAAAPARTSTPDPVDTRQRPERTDNVIRPKSVRIDRSASRTQPVARKAAAAESRAVQPGEGSQGDDGSPGDGDVEPEDTTPQVPPPVAEKEWRRAKAAGARGGRNFYRDRVRRGA